ncbi:MAG: T9SS type A sorting domain-containing protein, partial [Bacteroidetes bacterium]|nr:T9SS type A sorting domain-containing protein [Bacteroidota bacterium]
LGIIDNNDVIDRADAQDRLDVELTWDATAMPNPYNQYVTVSLSTESNSAISITMVDAMGKEVSRTHTTVEGLESVQLGELLTPGVYMIAVRQDDNVKMIRVVKQ